MQKYLVEKGIDPARIYLEDRSTNTHENLENSLQLIRQEGLCDTVVIATQVFHQYRAATLARWADAAGWGLCLSFPAASGAVLLDAGMCRDLPPVAAALLNRIQNHAAGRSQRSDSVVFLSGFSAFIPKLQERQKNPPDLKKA